MKRTVSCSIRMATFGLRQRSSGEPTAKADRGRHPGFPSFNLFAGGPGSLAVPLDGLAATGDPPLPRAFDRGGVLSLPCRDAERGTGLLGRLTGRTHSEARQGKSTTSIRSVAHVIRARGLQARDTLGDPPLPRAFDRGGVLSLPCRDAERGTGLLGRLTGRTHSEARQGKST